MLAVATWNLENFFRPSAEGGPTSQETYDVKLHGLASTIEGIGSDVIAVQEVGEPAALGDLAQLLGDDWQMVTSDHRDGRGIRVGFLSTLALEDVEQIVSFPDALEPIQQADGAQGEHEMGRGALRIRVQKDDAVFDLVTCHLKSKLLSFPGADGKTHFDTHDEDQRARYGAYALFRRAAEATTVRCYADQLLAGEGAERRVIVLGDFNDEPAAATTQIVLGPPGSQFGTGGFNHPDIGDGMRLWNLAPLIPEADRYSRIFEGQKELIDHILVSRRLADPTTEVTVHHQAEGSIGTDPRERRNAPASDHDPVIARLSSDA